LSKISFNIFLVYLLTYTFVIGLLTYFFGEITGLDVYNEIQQIFLLYFVFLTGFVFYVIKLVNRGDGRSFVTLFILSIVIKLILTIVLCGAVIYIFPERMNTYVLLIMIYYIIYTAFQLFFIKKLIDQPKQENTNK